MPALPMFSQRPGGAGRPRTAAHPFKPPSQDRTRETPGGEVGMEARTKPAQYRRPYAAGKSMSRTRISASLWWRSSAVRTWSLEARSPASRPTRMGSSSCATNSSTSLQACKPMYRRFPMRAKTMTRQLSMLTLVMVLVGGVQPGHEQPRSSPPISQAVLDEASRLNKLVEKLFSEGKFGEAVPSAERALAIREKALGPMHPDVAQSLNNLGLLY